jgi:hypothetical protein
VTPTVTQTPSPSPVLPPALLFIQPDSGSGSIYTDINTYLFNTGSTFWFGFPALPDELGTTTPVSDVVNWMYMYATSGVTGLPAVRQLTITSNLFDEFNIPSGTVPSGGIYGTGSASHVILVPTSTLVGYETQINQGTSSPPADTMNMDNLIYYNGGAAIINYVGPVFANTSYRMYVVSDMTGLPNTNTWYYKGSLYSLTP